jgi:hypothetical protein
MAVSRLREYRVYENGHTVELSARVEDFVHARRRERVGRVHPGALADELLSRAATVVRGIRL